MTDQTKSDNGIPALALIPVKIQFFHPGIREEVFPELNIISAELTEEKRKVTDYKRGLQQIMFLATHKVRQPITHLLGLSSMLVGQYHSQAELKQIAAYLRKSISAIDVFTQDLITYINDLTKSKND